MPDFSYSANQINLRNNVTDYAKSELNNFTFSKEEEHDVFRAWWKCAAEIGLTGMCVPKTYGGLGLGALDTTIALEALGYGCEDSGLNFALSAHLLAGVVPLCLHGSTAQHEKWLPGINKGELVITNAITEESAGSDVFSMQTAVSKDGEDYQLSGKKTYCSNGPVADLVLTYAITDASKGYFGGISALLVEEGQFLAGPQIEKAGLKHCFLSEICFYEVPLKPTQLIGKTGAGGQIFQQSMEWERICLGAVHLGEMERHLEKVVAHAKTRKSGGQSIGKYQAVSHPWANLSGRIAAARQLMQLAAWKMDQQQAVSKEASMVKLMISELYRDFAIQLHQFFAGAAFHESHFAARCLSDSAAATLYSGTSEVQRNVIARYLGFR